MTDVPKMRIVGAPEENIGYWSMHDGYIKVYVPKGRPKWLHRKMMQWLVGIKWVDVKDK